MSSTVYFSSSFNQSIKIFILFSLLFGFFTGFLHFLFFQLKHLLESGVFQADKISEMLPDFFNQGIFLLLGQLGISKLLVLASLQFFDPDIKFLNFSFNVLLTVGNERIRLRYAIPGEN